MSRHRSKNQEPLTPQDKIDVFHKVLVGSELKKDVAKEMRVSAAVVAKMVREFKHAGHIERLLKREREVEL